MRPHNYGDVFTRPRRHRIPEVAAEPGLVVEDPASGFCGAVITVDRGAVVLEARNGTRRLFPLVPAGFLLEGKPITLVPQRRQTDHTPARSASGSIKLDGIRARTARASRIWVEGRHDAELVERVWGHDLRVAGVVVEPLHGIDDLPGAVAEFGPAPHRRIGVLVDHLVKGSKESRTVAAIHDENVLVTGHPYVDIWEAVRPAVVGIDAWPEVPHGQSWKEGVCSALGWGEAREGWRRIIGAVGGFRDLESPLVGAVERLIDFVTATAAEDHA